MLFSLSDVCCTSSFEVGFGAAAAVGFPGFFESSTVEALDLLVLEDLEETDPVNLEELASFLAPEAVGPAPVMERFLTSFSLLVLVGSVRLSAELAFCSVTLSKLDTA